MPRLTLTVPMPPNMANGRMHWRTKHRARTEYFAACDFRQRARLVPKPPAVPFGKAALTVTMHVGARHDVDNAMARCKWAIDWLTTRGYIADDGPDCLMWTGFPEQVVKRGDGYKLVLTLDGEH